MINKGEQGEKREENDKEKELEVIYITRVYLDLNDYLLLRCGSSIS